MSTVSSFRPLTLTMTAAFVFVGCGTLGSQSDPVELTEHSTVTALSSNQRTLSRTLLIPSSGVIVYSDRRNPWMSPVAKSKKLLYVSDVGTNDVNVYSYPQGALVGQLTGFNEPQGECVDSVGNVLITNTLDSDILEFAHGGTTPIATWHDPGQYPVDCSYSRYLNSIAVANITSTNGGAGSISVYGNPSNPNVYSDPRLYRVDFLSYDRKNHLFVDGASIKGEFQYAKMGVLGHFYELNLNAQIGIAAGVQYSGDSKNMAIGDADGTIYKALGPNVVGTSKVNDPCSLGQFFITKSKVIVPEPCNRSVAVYPYPVGGTPMFVISNDLVEPVGAALSLPTTH